jgi:hypothetical protein
MKIKKISYMVPRDLVNDCLDACVTLEDDSFYYVEITTTRFIDSLMEKGKFLPPCYPYIIVSELTDEIIEAAIEEFVNQREDSFWLKLYFLVLTLNIKDVNQLLDQKEKEDDELEAEVQAEIEPEMKAESNISSDNQVILESISVLIFGSLISYCFLKPGLFNLFSDLIN